MLGRKNSRTNTHKEGGRVRKIALLAKLQGNKNTKLMENENENKGNPGEGGSERDGRRRGETLNEANRMVDL